MLVITDAQRRSVLASVLAAVDQKFMGAEPNARSMREEHEAVILGADTADDFEQAMNSMLKKLGTSHTGFFHEKRPRAAGRIAIAATLTKAETVEGTRWMFQDVHPGGVAAQAGIQSGDVLLKVGDHERLPPSAMPFVLGETYSCTVRRADRSIVSATENSGIERKAASDRGARPGGDCLQAARRHRADSGQHVSRCLGHGCGARHQPRNCGAGVRPADHRSPGQYRRRALDVCAS